jgi:hypothetical protein
MRWRLRAGVAGGIIVIFINLSLSIHDLQRF